MLINIVKINFIRFKSQRIKIGLNNRYNYLNTKTQSDNVYSNFIDFAGVIFATKYEGPNIINNDMAREAILRVIRNRGLKSTGTDAK